MDGSASRSDLVRRHVVVHGRVQGVFFRDSTRRLALELGVGGWVRNRPDGTVEAVFEGDPDAVAKMLEFCNTGPRGAAVSHVDVSAQVPRGDGQFQVRS
jgi:acylphosphatase